MLLVWSVTALSAAVAAACFAALRGPWRNAQRGWQLLAGSGVALSLGGLGFIVRFWEPLPGPYTANAVYPLGPYVNAWAVSFGFLWLAFGVAFAALALKPQPSVKTWLTLLAIWILAWLPHGIIAIGFAVAGQTEAGVALYRDWASAWPAVLTLWAGGLTLAAHVGLSAFGFLLAGRDLLRRSRSVGG